MFIYNRFKNIRIDKDLSQKELAKLICVSKVSVNGYELGNRVPSLNKLIKISEVLETTPNFLLGFDNYLIKEESGEYKFNLLEEELFFIKEARKNKKVYTKIINEPNRLIEAIEKNAIN